MTVETQPLVGFRRWVPWKEPPDPPGTLHSVRYPYLNPWPVDGPLTAKCLSWPHKWVPDKACDCGIYAFYDLSTHRHDGFVWGMVLGWGKVLEHEHGFRAERAEIKALLEPPWSNTPLLARITRRAADLYGVPTLNQQELVEYGKWWGEVKHPVPH